MLTTRTIKSAFMTTSQRSTKRTRSISRTKRFMRLCSGLHAMICFSSTCQESHLSILNGPTIQSRAREMNAAAPGVARKGEWSASRITTGIRRKAPGVDLENRHKTLTSP